MNIFVVDRDPVRAARALCDQHVVKMTLETAQLLCSPFEPGTAPYRRTHYQHPCALWTRASAQNYDWLVQHGLALAGAYQERYRKVHASEEVIRWCGEHGAALALPALGLTPFAQAVPEQFRAADPVKAYRAYYRAEKLRFARWNHGTPPPAWVRAALNHGKE